MHSGEGDFEGAGPRPPSVNESASTAPRPGLPWESESEGRTPGSGVRTVSMVLTRPTEAFRAMRIDGALGDPILFLVLFGTIGSAFGLLWQTFLRGWMFSVAGPEFRDLAVANGTGFVSLVMLPLFVLLFAAIAAAVYHLALLLFGGAPRGFDVTLRVVCYTSGASYLLLILPICGGILATLWGIPVAIVGLREAQGVPGGRAAAAVIVPMVLIFCCCALVWTLLVGMAVAIPGAIG
jgi:hypothetical protein